MAFGDRFKKVFSKVDPFAARMLGLDKEQRKKFAPKQQYWGGSEEESKRVRDMYEKGALAAHDVAREGVGGLRNAAATAKARYGELSEDARGQMAQAAEQAQADRAQALGAGADYRAGRGGSLANVAKIEGIADTAPSEYQRTAQAAFNAQSDQAMRQALAMGARGGAAGLRTALAAGSQANAQALQQAQITQAQEMNELMALRQQAYGQAAGIRQGVGAQDLSAAGLYTGREDAARTSRLAQQNVLGSAVGGSFGAQATAEQAAIGAGLAERAQNVGAMTNIGAAELGAAREQEAARQAYEKYQYTQNMFPLKRFNAPA